MLKLTQLLMKLEILCKYIIVGVKTSYSLPFLAHIEYAFKLFFHKRLIAYDLYW